MLTLLDGADGEVIFVNSTVGLAARAHTGAYAASKHALRALADSLRDEVNALGIRVLTVYLGNTATPMQKSIHEEEGRPYRPELFIQPEDVARLIAAAIELPRTAEVTEIRIQPFLRSA
jgi:NADP-dependent 3-hydroxy acid dehydrogenase YdfG